MRIALLLQEPSATKCRLRSPMVVFFIFDTLANVCLNCHSVMCIILSPAAFSLHDVFSNPVLRYHPISEKTLQKHLTESIRKTIRSAKILRQLQLRMFLCSLLSSVSSHVYPSSSLSLYLLISISSLFYLSSSPSLSLLISISVHLCLCLLSSLSLCFFISLSSSPSLFISVSIYFHLVCVSFRLCFFLLSISISLVSVLNDDDCKH